MRAVVVGGGLAGITAAIALAQAGAEVTLLEAKPRLGGATMSFTRDGLAIDTGQHVFLRCCTAYRGLLDRLGMTAHAPLQPRFDITVVSPEKRARMRRRRAPAPFHMLPALLGYPFLSFSERSRISRAALAFKRLNEADPKTDEIRLGDWLAAHGQDDRTRRVLWDLFSISSLNVPGDDASLALAAVVVKTGLLGDAGAADIGVPALSLGELHGAAAARLLGQAGRLRPAVDQGGGHRAERRRRIPRPAEPERAAERGRRRRRRRPPGGRPRRRPTRPENGEVLAADVVVLAVPHEQAARLIPAGALPQQSVDGWAGLGAAPIVNLHVRYDRKVMDVPFAAAVDSPVQWVFDRTRISGMHARGDDGQYLAVSLSAADPYVNMSVAELREMFVPALAGPVPRGPRGDRDRVLRHQGAPGHVPPGAGHGQAPPEVGHRAARPRAGRLVDRHRLAGHDGGRRPQRPQRRHRPARPARGSDRPPPPPTPAVATPNEPAAAVPPVRPRTSPPRPRPPSPPSRPRTSLVAPRAR